MRKDDNNQVESSVAGIKRGPGQELRGAAAKAFKRLHKEVSSSGEELSSSDSDSDAEAVSSKVSPALSSRPPLRKVPSWTDGSFREECLNSSSTLPTSRSSYAGLFSLTPRSSSGLLSARQSSQDLRPVAFGPGFMGAIDISEALASIAAAVPTRAGFNDVRTAIDNAAAGEETVSLSLPAGLQLGSAVEGSPFKKVSVPNPSPRSEIRRSTGALLDLSKAVAGNEAKVAEEEIVEEHQTDDELGLGLDLDDITEAFKQVALERPAFLEPLLGIRLK